MGLFSKLLNIIYPPRCPYCSKVLDIKSALCDDCYQKLDINSEIRYIDIDSNIKISCCSPFIYSGLIRKSIINFKFYSKLSFVDTFAESIANEVRKNYSNTHFDYISCVPMSKKSKRSRGYNQAELLAKSVSKKLNIKYVESVIKFKETKAQHNLNLNDRKTNVNGAYKLKNKNIANNKSILLVDDIITTGFTLKEVCKVLLLGQAKLVKCVTLSNAKIAERKIK